MISYFYIGLMGCWYLSDRNEGTFSTFGAVLELSGLAEHQQRSLYRG